MNIFKESSLKINNIYSLLSLFQTPVNKANLKKNYLKYPKLKIYFDLLASKELIEINKYGSNFFKISNKGKDFIHGFKNNKFKNRKNDNLKMQDLEIAISYYRTLGSLNRTKGKVVQINLIEEQKKKNKTEASSMDKARSILFSKKHAHARKHICCLQLFKSV